MIRNSHRSGDWLMVDAISGITYYASEMVQDWDGSYRHPSNIDGKHPDYVKRSFPKEAVPAFSTGAPVVPRPDLTLPTYIGGTTVRRPTSPADFLFL